MEEKQLMLISEKVFPLVFELQESHETIEFQSNSCLYRYRYRAKLCCISSLFYHQRLSTGDEEALGCWSVFTAAITHRSDKKLAVGGLVVMAQKTVCTKVDADTLVLQINVR